LWVRGKPGAYFLRKEESAPWKSGGLARPDGKRRSNRAEGEKQLVKKEGRLFS